MKINCPHCGYEIKVSITGAITGGGGGGNACRLNPVSCVLPDRHNGQCRTAEGHGTGGGGSTPSGEVK